MERFQLKERLIVFTKIPTDLAAIISGRFQMTLQMAGAMLNAEK